MDGATLADRLSRGMGAAARVFGTPYDAFRQRGADDPSCNPLAPERRFLRLPAAFDGGDPAELFNAVGLPLLGPPCNT